MKEGKKGSRGPFGDNCRCPGKRCVTVVSSGHRRSEDNLRSWNGQDTDGLDIKVREWEVSG